MTQTHYLPYFMVKQGDTVAYAICGTVIDTREHTNEPTCPTCKAYVEAEANDTRTVEDVFGTSDPSTLVPSDYDPLNVYGKSERFQRGGGR